LIRDHYKIRFAAKLDNMQPTIGFNEKVMGEIAHKLFPVVADELMDRVAERPGDFISSLIETHEKMPWMLRAHPGRA
jgi:hypothetical protein